MTRRPIPAADVIAAAKAELLARLDHPAVGIVLSLAQPVTAKLPEVAADDVMRRADLPSASRIPSSALKRARLLMCRLRSSLSMQENISL